VAATFDTVLIANRGEIALRVARTCKELGLRTVAVYSDDDASAALLDLVDRAVRIGPAPARRSYRNVPAIIEAALQTGAGAIHPGYGFLSEDPDFAEVCAEHGLVFVGPPAEVMGRLGDKASARALMSGAGLPLLPGSVGHVASAAEAADVAGRIGYPVIVKAVAGGGGRGMRVVTDPAQLRAAYHQARATAQSTFGDSRVYLERYLRVARHIEVQILADRYGGVVHLGERDCSVQRRHQKLVEESPAPLLDRALAARICAGAVEAMAAVGYVGAGTVEFLLDDTGDFYFMEVNCRIQVEHPVTEMVTGVDLVREQLLVAAGEPLPFRQDDLAPRGVAIECRINAEDADRDFAPAPGQLTGLRLPGGPFVRVDTYAEPTTRISPQYDSLLAKVVAWAPDRPQALARMRRALAELRVTGPGVHTTAGFLSRVLDQHEFQDGRHTTGLVDRMLSATDTDREERGPT
jgi:acetyl-CoA carboxylase biotin carboxylase subunit